jgi:hypothetical protein
VSTIDTSPITWRKSSRSHANGGDCIEVGVWRKTIRSADNGGSCVAAEAWRKSGQSEGNSGAGVEVPTAWDTSTLFLMRDSKDPVGPNLALTVLEWTAFLTQIKTGTLDLQTDRSR